MAYPQMDTKGLLSGLEQKTLRPKSEQYFGFMEQT